MTEEIKCPTCGEPITFETTIGVRYCRNAHASKAPDYPRVVMPPPGPPDPPHPIGKARDFA